MYPLIPSSIEDRSQRPIHISEVLRDRRMFMIGSTGFVGKVYLFLLLRRHIDVAKVYCLIRPKSGTSPADRLRQEVLTSPVFDPLREQMGSEAFEWIALQKLEAIEGDVGVKGLGITPEKWEELKGSVDVIVNSSGLVDFNPSLEEALKVNTIGIQHLVEVAEQWRSRLLHVSTCYVAGKQNGAIFENSDLIGWFPFKGQMEGVDFDVNAELKEGLAMVEQVRLEAKNQQQIAHFVHEARTRLKDATRNPNDEAALDAEVERLREKWINKRLTEYGLTRAESYGWTNTYTYSKCLGEQIVAGANIPWTIVRPSIVESSQRFPFPGWNEGFNTTAPLTFLVIKGHINIPVQQDLCLDLIPVDLVAAGMIAATAALLEDRHKPVYHLASSDVNPCRISRMVELVGLYKRKYYLQRSRGNPILNDIFARFESVPVSLERYHQISAPRVATVAGMVAKAARYFAGERSGGVAARVVRETKAVEKQARNVDNLVTLFLPFTYNNSYRFRCENIRNLYAQLSPEDRATMPWDPESIDWLVYWLEVHTKGLEKWVFPRIKDKLQRKPLPDMYTYEDLLELFDAATTNNPEETALRLYSAAGEERFTYAQMRERATWAATFLRTHGLAENDRVVMCGENRPQWGMVYFGILQAGGTSVPVDSRSTIREIMTLVLASDARALVVSDKFMRSNEAALREQLPSRVSLFPFSEVLAQPTVQPVALVPRQPGERVASIIYTSGTTGIPKGVMLSHANFANLLSAMARLFHLGPRDRLLSVLPLHHTFEFTTGFLLPLSRGSSITYLDELSGEMVQEALKRYKVTAMVGVPALWDLLFRKIRARVQERGAAVEAAFFGLHRLHRAIRDYSGLNLGPYLFAPIFDGFGGRMRYLISGGSALPSDVQRGFDGFGLDLYEGYGMTEASPVLTVNRPGRRPTPGSVGVAVPGVEVEIHQPDESGIGEIIARGPNVMTGYFRNEEATREVLVDGWLHTGDLGRKDKAGRLFIVGRKKEVIIDSAGKNIYPDEIEDIYSGCSYIKELSVVGIPDGRGAEQTACLVVPETEGEAETLCESEVRSKIEDHFRSIGLTLPYFKRIKVLRFQTVTLPRTATRKVKRRDVVKLLQDILKLEEQKPLVGKNVAQVTDEWLMTTIARITGRKVDSLTPQTRFADDLGMDSLTATELLSSLDDDRTGGLEIQDLVDAYNIEGLAIRLRERSSRSRTTPVLARSTSKLSLSLRDVKLNRIHELPVDPVIRDGVRGILRVMQRTFYEKVLDVRVKGRAFIPANRNVLVVSNHASHLDMGLVKAALGDFGEHLITLAASDYFFAEGPRRFYFENFTHVVPLDRLNPSRESLWRAESLLRDGNNLLLFPEGTRTTTGEIQEFKRGVGMMALKFRVDVLPIYLSGTYESMPRGALYPRRRKLEVRIGAPVRYEDLVAVTQTDALGPAQARVSRVLQRAVEALRDQRYFDIVTAAKDGPTKSTLEQLFDWLQARFDPGRVEQPISFYFSLGPDDEHKWSLDISRVSCTVTRGKRSSSADCVMKTSIPMFARIVRDAYIPAISEFMDGTVKTNDPGKLQKFQAIFRLDE